MKLVYRRSTAATALAEPPVAYAPEPASPEPVPAPAGALHRVFPSTVTPGQSAEAEDEYVPLRGSYGMRLRGGIPRSLPGRILLASATVLLLGVMALAAAAGRRFLLHDPRFQVASSSAIDVEGNEHISRGDVLGIFGADLERNIFMIPLAERRANLERLPWVAHATVERLLPNRLRIRLQERVPIAFVREGSHIGLVDASGVLLDMPPDAAGDPHYSFPVLTGLAPDDTPEQRTARMEVFRRFLADLDSGGQRRTQALSEVDVTNPEDVKALVTLGGADILVHFGEANFLRRFEAYQRHLPEWRAQYPRLASADMRYERQVVLEMQGGTTPPPMIAPAEAEAPAAKLAATARAQPSVAHPSSAHRAAAGHSASNDRIFRHLASQQAAQQATHRAAERR